MQKRRAFTLVELMTVIGIIVVLMAIIIPSVMRATIVARRTKQAADLQAITVALTAYHQDFRAYPVVYDDGEGALVLSKALIGPEPAFLPKLKPAKPDRGDGADGPGFRTKKPLSGVEQGKKWGPYLNIDQFQTAGDPGFEILDMRGRPILYYPTYKPAGVSPTPARYLNTVSHAAAPDPANRPYINAADNWDPADSSRQYLEQTKMDQLLGIDRANNQFLRPPPTGVDYVLWSSGPDEIFGPLNPAHPEKCDDVTNLSPQ